MAIQVIQRPPKGPTTNQALAQAVQQGLESYKNERDRTQKLSQLSQQNEAESNFAQKIGLGGLRNASPEVRKTAIAEGLKAEYKRSLENEKRQWQMELFNSIENPEDFDQVINQQPQEFSDEEIDSALNEASNELGPEYNVRNEQERDEFRQELRRPKEQMQEGRIKQEADPFLKAKKYAAAGMHDASRVAGEEARTGIRQTIHDQEQIGKSYQVNSKFIDKTYDQYEGALNKEATLDKMIQKIESGELSNSGLINTLETLGISPDFLKNPENEEFTKLSLDLLGGGTLQSDYGSRVLASEFQNSLRRIPTLSQTDEGKRQIAENMKTMLLPSILKQQRLEYYIDKAKRTGQPLPFDLRGQILKDIKPQLTEAYDKFKQRNGRYEVRKGTEPDDDALEKYYYLSNGDEAKARKLMKEDGYALD